ncbi:MAG: ABC transporter ATP-binding protein [Lachnospiraceae bacterium]|nr:ABC transporter ATP-binding protein [Lachnospiraceae bacterium]MDD7177308.1 ABC transporter ATP-binding protein [bacterium]MDY5517423.1 ABC transporter ATP-binding protein [Lachnospiraceae bacterium]
MSQLVCENIAKQYKKKEVLHDINLTIEQGKIYGLVGRNGAGKTTLLSIMTAQNPATAGTVTLDGMPVWENQKALDHLCFSRELNTLSVLGPNTIKVKEYLQMARTYYPNWDREMEKRLVAQFELNPKKKISKLSKGMLSMVTIIVALASKADITILDEPVAGLDVVARDDFYRLLLEEHEATGRTFIVSTHIIEEAANVFEEVIFLKDGDILLKENTQDLLDRAVHVSGLAEEVDNACAGLEIHHVEQMGRSKGVTVLLNDGEQIPDGYDVTVQPVSLQNLFVALCGREA